MAAGTPSHSDIPPSVCQEEKGHFGYDQLVWISIAFVIYLYMIYTYIHIKREDKGGIGRTLWNYTFKQQFSSLDCILHLRVRTAPIKPFVDRYPKEVWQAIANNSS